MNSKIQNSSAILTSNGQLDSNYLKVQQLNARLTGMSARLSSPSSSLVRESTQDVIAELVEALEVSVEELRVTNDMLIAQNEKLAEAQIRAERERQRYEDLFNFSPDPLLITDLNLMIREANKSAAKLLNIESQYLKGKPMVLYIHEEERRKFTTEAPRLRQILSRNEVKYRLQPRDQEALPASLHVATVYNRSGEAQGLRWLIRECASA